MTISCRSEFDPQALSVEQAREQIFAGVEPVAESRRLPLRTALGHVLAEDVTARLDVPGFTNSAMDGYAVRHADLQRLPELRIVGTSWAGAPYGETLNPGETVRIMTGAAMPDGADTVVIQEQTQAIDDRLQVSASPQPGEFVRHPGDDVKRGEIILARGKRLAAADIGLLASQGYADVSVRRPLVVAFFSTGDELAGVGQPLSHGQVHDSNRYTLYGLLHEQGVQTLDLGVIRDDRAALREAFDQAARSADVLITTGGVSAGDADFVKDILIERGVVSFWKIAMRPGRPLTFGRLERCVFFGLPGNPVSVAVTFDLFVKPALVALSGARVGTPLSVEATLHSNLNKARGRRDFQRGILRRENGEFQVTTTGGQGSHVLSSMSAANCYIVLPEESTGATPGDTVTVLPFAVEL